MTFHKHTHWSFCARLASIYGRAAVPKASVGYLVDRKPPLAKQAHKTNKGAIFGYLGKQREMFLKNSLVASEVSNKTVPLEKSAHDTLQPGRRGVRTPHRAELASRNRTVRPDTAVEMNYHSSLTSSGATC